MPVLKYKREVLQDENAATFQLALEIAKLLLDKKNASKNIREVVYSKHSPETIEESIDKMDALREEDLIFTIPHSPFDDYQW